MKTLLITDSDFAATDKNFQYLLGFQPSFWAMIIWKNKIQIFLDSRYFENTKTIDELSLKKKVWNLWLSIEYIQIKTGLIDLLAENLKSKQQVHFSNNISLKYYNSLKSLLKNTDIHIVENIFWKKRIIKSDLEIKNISRAIEIIDRVFEYIFELNKQWELLWKTELQVRSIIISKVMEFGWNGESFDSIVWFGENSAIPHHSAWETVIWEGVLLIDMWALYKWYCSDFTRTFWVSSPNLSWGEGIEQEEFEKIYNIVKQAHNIAFENTKAWMTWEDVDSFARKYIEEAWYGEYFTHSTGHWIWLDVHELPSISKNKENILEDGMVFTIEPWIYLPWKFWVRLEDIVFMKDWKLEKVSSIEL